MKSHLNRLDQIRNMHVTPITPNKEKMVYKPGVGADDIVIDGWMREFDVSQTEEELQAQGYFVSRSAILQAWVALDEQMEEDTPKMLYNNDAIFTSKSDLIKQIAEEQGIPLITIDLVKESNVG